MTRHKRSPVKYGSQHTIQVATTVGQSVNADEQNTRGGYVSHDSIAVWSWELQVVPGEMAAIVQANVDVENIVKRMFSNERKKKAVSRTVVQVMSAHQRD